MTVVIEPQPGEIRGLLVGKIHEHEDCGGTWEKIPNSEFVNAPAGLSGVKLVCSNDSDHRTFDFWYV